MPASNIHHRAGPILARPSTNLDSNRRTAFTDTSLVIYGWPAREGVIIIEEVTHVDFDFLRLNTTNPPPSRNTGQAFNSGGELSDIVVKEDRFCQPLLLLGAKWWDSETQY